MKKLSSLCLKIGTVVLFWGAVWFLVSQKIGNDFLFPSPAVVLREGAEMVQDKTFWFTVLLSLVRVFWGILASWIIGIAAAFVMYKSKLLRLLFSPLMTAVKSTPVASFIILALLWLDRNVLPVFITALMVIPVVWANLTEGIHAVDPQLVEVASVYRFSPAKRLMRLYVPSVAPYFMAACRSSIGMAWKAGIAAEVLATPDYSIGKELYFSKTYLETPALFVWTLMIIFLSILIEKLLIFGLERLGNKLHLFSKGFPHVKN